MNVRDYALRWAATEAPTPVMHDGCDPLAERRDLFAHVVDVWTRAGDGQRAAAVIEAVGSTDPWVGELIDVALAAKQARSAAIVDSSASPLLPDVDAETYAQAQDMAAKFSAAELTCDADDVLLAGYLAEFGQHCMAQPKTQTKALRRLFDTDSEVSIRCLIGLAQSLRKMHGASLPIEQACVGFVSTLVAVLVTIAPDQKRFGKHKGG